jgi:hypothetical protein
MREYKIVKTTHKYSKKSNKIAYAVVVSTYLIAEPDAILKTISTKNPDDMYVIANSYQDACELVCDWVHNPKLLDVDFEDDGRPAPTYE